MSDFNAERTIRARRVHGCSWCETPIQKGDRYRRSSGVFEGDIFSLPFHPECAEARDKDHDGDAWCPERHEKGQECRCWE